MSRRYGACGFNNNNISVYSSATLSNSGWRVETLDAVPRAARAVGEYWQPNFEFNPNTHKYVLWWLYSKPGTTLGLVQVGVADTPAGPFAIVNRNVSLAYKSFTSANLFVDRPLVGGESRDPGTKAANPVPAYLMYSSFRDPAKSGKFPGTAVIQRLDDSWTRTAAPAQHSGQFGVGEAGVAFRWDSPTGDRTIYYALEGYGCCFCPTGSDLIAWRSPTPLGPWTKVRGAHSINPPWPSPSPSPPASPAATATATPRPPTPPPPASPCHGGCQTGTCCVPRYYELPTAQQGVTPLPPAVRSSQPPAKGCEGGMVMWSGDAWQQAPDDRKEHDPQWWVPLCFNVDGVIGNLTAMKQWTVSGPFASRRPRLTER